MSPSTGPKYNEHMSTEPRQPALVQISSNLHGAFLSYFRSALGLSPSDMRGAHAFQFNFNFNFNFTSYMVGPACSGWRTVLAVSTYSNIKCIYRHHNTPRICTFHSVR